MVYFNVFYQVSIMNKEMIEVEMQWFTSMYSMTIMNKEMIEV